MKKIVFLLFILLLSANTLFSQESELQTAQSSEADAVDVQGEVLRWEAVPRAKKYQVTIEQLQDDNSWKKVKSVTTANNSYNANLDPGEYRVSIATFNILGKKGPASDWVEFTVLGNQTPYLYYNYFNKVSKYNAPVLLADSKKQKSTSADYKQYIHADKDKPENSFTVKGRHIFYSSTKFNLVPVEKSINGGNNFDLYNRNRKTVELSVVSKESKKYKTTLQYDPAQLGSGYYNLEATNPDGSKYAVSILVIADEKLEIKPGNFEYDERYKINKISVSKSGNTEIQIYAKGINEDVKYYLRPDQNIQNYPFNSQQALERVYGEASYIRPKEEGWYEVGINFNVENLRTSYYTFYAQKDYTESESFNVLVERPLLTDSEHQEKIEKIKTKLKKRSTDVIVTVDTKKFSGDSQYTLVSQYVDAIDGNSKLKVDLVKGKKSGTYTTKFDYSNLSIGKYGLQVDNEDGTFVYTFEINSYFKSKEIKLSNEEFTCTFYRPVNGPSVASNNQTDSEEDKLVVHFLGTKSTTIKNIPYFVPYAYFNFGYAPMLEKLGITPFNVNAEMDILNFGLFALSPGVSFTPNARNESSLMYPDLKMTMSARFIVPGKYFSPYLSAGVGAHIMQYGTWPKWVTLNFDNLFMNNDYFAESHVGLILFSFLNFGYHLEWHNFMHKEKQYFYDYFSMGFRMPLNPPYYTTEYTNKEMELSGKEIASGKEIDISNSYVMGITFTGIIRKVQDFNKLPEIITITFRNCDIEEIGPECFANCSTLKRVYFEGTPYISTIRKGAFRNDTQIGLISLPITIKTIEAGAFAGWTSDQKIKLMWNSTDTTVRDLRGLKNLKCEVVYNDGVPYAGE